MKKTHHLVFASNQSKEEVVDQLESRLDLTFNKHESSYFGEYYKYTGLHADNISIFNNTPPPPYQDGILEDSRPEHQTIIKINISSGKNKDKQSKSTFLKHSFKNNFGLELVSEKITEST